jgi:hypothetical protein
MYPTTGLPKSKPIRTTKGRHWQIALDSNALHAIKLLQEIELSLEASR